MGVSDAESHCPSYRSHRTVPSLKALRTRWISAARLGLGTIAVIGIVAYLLDTMRLDTPGPVTHRLGDVQDSAAAATVTWPRAFAHHLLFAAPGGPPPAHCTVKVYADDGTAVAEWTVAGDRAKPVEWLEQEGLAAWILNGEPDPLTDTCVPRGRYRITLRAEGVQQPKASLWLHLLQSPRERSREEPS